MKLKQIFKDKLIPLACTNGEMCMKSLTVKEVKALQSVFKPMEKNPEDMGPMMYLFQNVLVDQDGEVFEDIKPETTIEDLEDVLKMDGLKAILEEVSKILSGNSEGK